MGWIRLWAGMYCDYPGEPVPERWNRSGFYWSKRQWVAVASAGPYASLHLSPDRQPCQQPTTQFLQARCPSCRPNQQRQSTEGTSLQWIYAIQIHALTHSPSSKDGIVGTEPMDVAVLQWQRHHTLALAVLHYQIGRKVLDVVVRVVFQRLHTPRLSPTRSWNWSLVYSYYWLLAYHRTAYSSC